MREQLAHLLARYEAAGVDERDSLALMRELVESLEHPFARTQPQAHFTGSAFVVDEAVELTCLVHHRAFDRWLQPGGHVEPSDGDWIEQTALREAAEETGCEVELHPDGHRPFDVDVHEIDARGGVAAHLHLDVRFLVIADDPDLARHQDNESHALEWLTLDEAEERCDEESITRMIEKARQVAAR